MTIGNESHGLGKPILCNPAQDKLGLPKGPTPMMGMPMAMPMAVPQAAAQPQAPAAEEAKPNADAKPAEGKVVPPIHFIPTSPSQSPNTSKRLRKLHLGPSGSI